MTNTEKMFHSEVAFCSWMIVMIQVQSSIGTQFILPIERALRRLEADVAPTSSTVHRLQELDRRLPQDGKSGKGQTHSDR